MAPMTPALLAADLLAGLSTTVWYALPDYTRSRPLRIIAKGAILAANAVYGSAAIRKQAESEVDSAAPEPTPGSSPKKPSLHSTDSRSPGAAPCSPARHPHVLARHPLILASAVVAVLGGSVALTVGMERFVYRFGERLSGRGVHLPHSRIGVVLGVVSTAATLAADALRTRTRPAGIRSTDPA